ncbi:MAG: polysaccharide deacetylase family protein [Candidatus Wallbacteria bacterium]
MDNNNYAAILMYHHIGDPPPGVKLWALYVSRLNFTFQMWYLKTSGFNVIPLSELRGMVASGKKLPPYTVALTFDDGFCDFYNNAAPILEKYKLPATVFMVSDQIGKTADWEDIHLTGTDRLMNNDELAELLKNPLIEIAPHTKNHKKLPKLNYEQAYEEINGSLKTISGITGQKCESFAAPYGEYNSETLDILRKCEIKCAVTTDNRAFDTTKDNLLEIPRIIIRRNNHPPGFMYKMSRVFKRGK